ncbi:hypothetical protein TNCV_2161791 [Trichonephila clavipes]|nr:hypothetical protein TNCV_2161791 [Trichonephila clavipes]
MVTGSSKIHMTSVEEACDWWKDITTIGIAPRVVRVLKPLQHAKQRLPTEEKMDPRVPRAHQAGSSRRSLAGVGLSESVRCHGPGLALLTNGGVQQQQLDCQVIYSQFGLAIHQNDHKARRRFVEWAQNEIAVVPDFHKRILFSNEAHFWLNGYVIKQNCRIWSEVNPQVYVKTPLHPEKLTVWCALWAGGILLQKR